MEVVGLLEKLNDIWSMFAQCLSNVDSVNVFVFSSATEKPSNLLTPAYQRNKQQHRDEEENGAMAIM